ncbi:MAG: glycosyltransferase [Candidatus Limnocylindrales bacterium]
MSNQDRSTETLVVPRTAFVSTYVPRHCGIATFTRALVTGLQQVADGSPGLSVVALERAGEHLPYPREVTHRLTVDLPVTYRDAGRWLKASGADVLSLQHEYGIFGGPSGSYVLDLLDAAGLPVVSTLHTILAHPTAEQEAVLREVVARSARLVTMSARGRAILTERYGADQRRIAVIPHGVPDFEGHDRDTAKAALGLAGSTLLLSAGLLGPGKNVELVLEAFARITEEVPNALYAVVGATHPEVQHREGERYRQQLMALATTLGIERRVRFVDRYLSDAELTTWLTAADVFVTPYRNAEQITSGTLAYALAAGAAVVSTPYEHAKELLRDGRGVLVPFEDPRTLAHALARLLSDEYARAELQDRGRTFAQAMTWPNVARQYAQLFAQAAAEPVRMRRSAVQRSPVAVMSRGPRPRPSELPLARAHLQRLRTPLGIVQFAHGKLPDQAHGYCTDDVARALLVDLRHARLAPGAATSADLYGDLTFLWDAFDAGLGRFRNQRGADGQWLERIGSEDAHGRAIQALGETIARCEDRWAVLDARGLFAAALPASLDFAWSRPRAYAILGCSAALADPASADRARTALEALVARLGSSIVRARTTDPGWPWPEPTCTYDNGVLPEALIAGGAALARPRVIELGLQLLGWLASAETAPTGHLRPIGNHGWWPRGGRPAGFDQQPIEAASLLFAAARAWEVTGSERWAELAERAFDWFLGANDLGLPLADPASGACHDGLGADGVNANAGAESTLVWLLAVERLRELRQARSDARRRSGTGQARMYASTSDNRAVAKATAASAAP